MSESRGRRARRDALPSLCPVDLPAVTTRILAVDPDSYDGLDTEARGQLLDRLTDLDRLIAALHGEVNRTIAALSPRPARSRRPEDAVVDEICAARRVGAWTAARMVSTARLCAGRDAPAALLQDALLAGATSPAHVDRFVAATSAVVTDVLSPDEVAAGRQPRTRGEKLAEIVAGTTRSARLDTPAQYRTVVEAAVCRVDGAAEAERRRVAARRRDVFTGRKVDDPLASLTLLDDPGLIARVMGRVQKRARRLQLARGGANAARNCPDARIGACRADVLADLLDQLTADDPDLPDGCRTGPLPHGAPVDPLPADTGRLARNPQREGFLVIDLATLRRERDNPCLRMGPRWASEASPVGEVLRCLLQWGEQLRQASAVGVGW